MAASGNVTVAPTGGAQAKLHPYVLTLVRWCMSCVWGTATVLLHRLMTAPLTPIGAPKPEPKTQSKPRAPGTDHLHPEPRVECVVLHEPTSHTLDVIFVHGLYGSLGNTWRQGDWRPKYKTTPNIVPLRENIQKSYCECPEMIINKPEINDNDYEMNDNYLNSYKINFNDNLGIENLDKLKKILPNENLLITEKFYNNSLLNRFKNGENYEIQAEFVKDMFKNDICDNDKFIQNKSKHINDNKCNNECKCRINKVQCNQNCRTGCNNFKNRILENDVKRNGDSGSKCINNENECEYFDTKIKLNENKACEMGCGCVCDECYSLCWPKDWIKLDFPGARVISINYTSDPYLWRPLWVKGNKRLRLHERADQMLKQLLDMRVGEKPIVWVGHSKGGLFIKQIYCEAYETYLNLNQNESKMNKSNSKKTQDIFNIEQRNVLDNLINSSNYKCDNKFNKSPNSKDNKDSNDNCKEAVFDNETNTKTENNNALFIDNKFIQGNKSLDSKGANEITITNKICFSTIKSNSITNDNIEHKMANKTNNIRDLFNETLIDLGINKIIAENGAEDNQINTNYALIMNGNEMKDNYKAIDKENDTSVECDDLNIVNDKTNDNLSSNDNKEDQSERLASKARLWENSVGFMFYSVPHRGSPLADIKTPITSRSIELLEISKDCALVLSLQERWLAATASPQPAVRSLVETCKTLMSVLWLRIVSVDSADAGIGSLSGVAVDHREICKPTSRTCMLYKELTDLIDEALNKCNCKG